MTGAQIRDGAFKALVAVAAFLAVDKLGSIEKRLEVVQHLQVEQAVGKTERATLRADVDDVVVRVGHVELGLAEVKAACAALRSRAEIKPGR